MIVFKFSRWREFRADAAGASLAGRGDMIAALERLRGKQDMPQELPGELTAFGISEQLKQGLGALFSLPPAAGAPHRRPARRRLTATSGGTPMRERRIPRPTAHDDPLDRLPRLGIPCHPDAHDPWPC
jgi:hypothetical protein